MFKIPVGINYERKTISYGQIHEIGHHLSTFVNLDFKMFQLIKDAVYCMDDAYLPIDVNDFFRISTFFQELFYICFSDSFLQDRGIKPEHLKEANRIFTPKRRFIYFRQKNPDFQKKMDLNYEINFDIVDPSFKPFYNPDIPSRSEVIENVNDSLLISLLKHDPKFIEKVNVSNFQSFLFLEFLKILEFNITVRICKNCNLYFVPRGRSDSLYCENFYNNTGKTCREIGIGNVYKEKINSNDTHKIFNRFYKKMYARRTKGVLSEAGFIGWLDKAKEARDNALQNATSGDNFEKILIEMED